MMNNPQKSLTSAVVQLIQAAYLVAPALVILVVLLAGLIISITLLFSPLMIGSLVVLVVFTAILIFLKRERALEMLHYL